MPSPMTDILSVDSKIWRPQVCNKIQVGIVTCSLLELVLSTNFKLIWQHIQHEGALA